jgi:hypothetical protein
MVEVVLAAFMLGIGMTLTMKMLGWVALERRVAERRECAVQEAANLMERLGAFRWNELTDERARRLALSERARAALPGAELSVRVERPADDARRLVVNLRWRNRAGSFDRPVRLTSWRFQPGSPP